MARLASMNGACIRTSSGVRVQKWRGPPGYDVLGRADSDGHEDVPWMRSIGCWLDRVAARSRAGTRWLAVRPFISAPTGWSGREMRAQSHDDASSSSSPMVAIRKSGAVVGAVGVRIAPRPASVERAARISSTSSGRRFRSADLGRDAVRHRRGNRSRARRPSVSRAAPCRPPTGRAGDGDDRARRSTGP